MNFEEKIKEIYFNIISNWDNIKYDKNIMNVLDMRKNSMCRYHKSINPNLNNSYIQAYVLTYYIMMLLIIND